MDLKDTILQTLQEIEEFEDIEEISKPKSKISSDKKFFEDLRERLLVLFEGLQSPNTENLDVKCDVVINFLEYLLVKIEEKLSSGE